MPTLHVQQIEPGDLVAGGSDDIPCRIIHGPVPGTDLFGRDTLRFWARREDTGEEGWLIYGPTGFVTVIDEPTKEE